MGDGEGMNAVLINPDDYVLSGEGANGQSYNHLHDSNLMIKLYNTGYDRNAIISELETAGKVYALGIPSPEPGELVTDGTRLGIRFKRIVGKRSFARAIADEPDRVEEYTREFAGHCKRLHSIQLPEGTFPDARTSFLRLLEGNSFLGKEPCDIIGRFITDSIPDCCGALHGDMHFGNMLTTLPEGRPISEKHDIHFIDLGYFEQGYPLLDIGMLHNICVYSDDSFLEENFHFGRALALEAWRIFVDEYFFGEERLVGKYFKAEASVDEVNEGLIPYTIVKLLLVGYNIGFMPDGYRKFILGNLDKLK